MSSPRGELSLDLNEIERPSKVESANGYHHITPTECQVLAAENASVANLMIAESDIATAASHDEKSRKVARLTKRLYMLRAAYQRNGSVADAMAAYFRLAEAEFGHDQIRRADSELKDMIGLAEKLRDSGLDVDTQVSEFRRKQFELESQLADITKSIGDLNGTMRLLFATPPESHALFWPDVQLTGRSTEIDENVAIEVAMINRPDIAALDLIAANLDVDSLSVARRILGQSGSFVGSLEASGRAFLALACQNEDWEYCIRKKQLSQAMYDQRRLAAEDVRSAIRIIQSAAEQSYFARAELTSWQSRIDELLRLKDIGQATEFAVSEARLSEIRTRAKLVKHLASIEVGYVRLLEAQGLLADACGPILLDKPRRPSRPHYHGEHGFDNSPRADQKAIPPTPELLPPTDSASPDPPLPSLGDSY